MGIFKKYKFKPSFESKTKAKIIQLTETYENICIKAIKKEVLTPQESHLLLDGVEDIKEYLIQGIFFKMTEDYNSKSPVEKKAETLFNQLLNIYSYTGDPYGSVKYEINEITLDVIYGALGYDPSITPFEKQVDNSYFIKYIQTILFYKVLNYLEKKTNSIRLSREEEKEKIEDIEENEMLILLEESNLKEALPLDIYNELKESIIKDSYPKHLIPYVQLLKK